VDVTGVDDGARQLADDLAGALAEYAELFRSAARIASRGAGADEIAEWGAACFEEAVSLRLLEEDSIGFVDGAPDDTRVLVREIYESLVVLSGVERPAHALSMPVATCADGTSLSALLREKGELGRWSARVGRPLAPPDMPSSLLGHPPSPASAALGLGEGNQLAANADRELIEDERSRDLNDVFAGRISEAMRLYADAVESARAGSDADLHSSLTASAREEAPALLGFARLTDRRTLGLDPPAAAAPVARLVADGFVTLAAAEDAEDIATLAYPSTDDIEDAARSLRGWLARLGTV
jgi:hypothetical protein